jgi:dipeptidyl-peptidase-4
MLTTGDIDDNVHPANTVRMANAFIKAHKRFDFFVLPGIRHSYQAEADYFFWVRSDYFCRWLLGKSPDSVDIVELNREKEQTGEKRGNGEIWSLENLVIESLDCCIGCIG